MVLIIRAGLNRVIEYVTFPLMPMGVLTPGSAHARPSAQLPIEVSITFSGRVASKHLP